MKALFLLLFLFLFTGSNAQYPFESKRHLHYMRYTHWKVLDTTNKRSAYSINIPRFFSHRINLRVLVSSYPGGADSSVITLFKGKGQLQSFVDPYFVGSIVGPAPQAVYIEDVNGDGLKDIKILIDGNACCGAYNFYQRVIYLFQKPNGKFSKVAFTDLAMDYKNKLERDFDGDGNYEIIVQSFQNYGDHNYFLFNLYNFKNGQLTNVNSKADYPIMVQLLNRENYAITKNLTRKKMKEFTKKLPDDYHYEL